jgi:predicted site-specific integrase-resolvase
MDLDSNKLLYKSSEVAKMFGITTATLKKWVKTGKIDCITQNTHRYFTKEQIQDYIDRNTTFLNEDKV